MISIYLTDILKRICVYEPDLKIEKTKLFRHSLNSPAFRACNSRGVVNEYQQLQKEGFFKNCDYVLSFLSGPGSSAKFIGIYRVIDKNGKKANANALGNDFNPMNISDNDNIYQYLLEKLPIMSDLENRLIIDWGKSTISWSQWATNEKEVIAIQEYEKFTFKGYENLILDFCNLEEIIHDNILYENWHTALKSVYAIYLIVDTVSGQQYVGSAYGDGGLLGRWTSYIKTGHGGNKLMQTLLKEFPGRENDFQFSILQIIPKNYTAEDVIQLETLYKDKLQTKKFGLNDN